ncbi:Counting factor associated protein D [Stylophora pistillata]|uniref:Counting factor associated protein D n=1 Tax=Stylophora pistillata TaxID=50429 RepID=A0A2B4SQU7_STYPI|nr:Counting factor associated protein D [Stylophora pistillata]
MVKAPSWFKTTLNRTRSLRRRLLLLVFLLAAGIVYYVFYQDHEKKDTPLGQRMTRHVFTVEEILQFPDNYHTKGVLSLPYGDIVEPFEAWYSKSKKMSRIDYYNGMDKTFQRGDLGRHGFACKIVPEYSEVKHKTFTGCMHRRGTKKFPIKAQNIIPAPSYFKYSGSTELNGAECAKWEHSFTIYDKVNTYTLYTTKTRPLKPLRYEMMGYDTLLASYYDHYILDYHEFEAWKFNYSVFDIPTAVLKSVIGAQDWMAEITSIPPFDPFEQTGSVGPRWDRWKTRLQYYIDARGVTVDNRKRALLLHLARPAVQDIFATLSDTGTTYIEALTALNTYISPQKSLEFERRTFRQAHQMPNESIAQYVTRSNRLGEHCDFDKYSLDEAVMDQLIEHCHSNTLRRRLQAANIENTSSQERSHKAHQLTTPTVSEKDQVNFTSEKQQQCTHCGNQRDHQPRTPRCPAFRKTCSQCGILHYFGRMCMKKTKTPGHPNGAQASTPKARYVCNSSDEDDCHEAFHLNPNQAKADITLTIEDIPVRLY